MDGHGRRVVMGGCSLIRCTLCAFLDVLNERDSDSQRRLSKLGKNQAVKRMRDELTFDRWGKRVFGFNFETFIS